MLLDSQKAEKTFRKIKQVRNEIKAYCLAPDRPAISAQEVHRVVERMYGLQIEIWDVPFIAVHLRGLVERYQARAFIFIRYDQDSFWKRFSIFKELCHIIIDESEDWSCEGDETISKFLAESQFRNTEIAAPVAQSETFAEIAAIELLYPYPARCKDKFNAEKLNDISNYYEIPAVMVGRALTDHYHAIAQMLWDKIGFE